MSDGTAHCPRGASHHLVGSWGSRRQTTITRDRKVLSSVRAHGAAPAAIARPSTPLHTHPHFLPAPPRLPNVCVFDHDLTSCMPPQSPCVLTSGLLYMYQYLTPSVRVCRPSPHFPASCSQLYHSHHYCLEASSTAPPPPLSPPCCVPPLRLRSAGPFVCVRLTSHVLVYLVYLFCIAVHACQLQVVFTSYLTPARYLTATRAIRPFCSHSTHYPEYPIYRCIHPLSCL